MRLPLSILSFFFFNDTATTEIYTLSLHDALPISVRRHRGAGRSTTRGPARRPDARLLLEHDARGDRRWLRRGGAVPAARAHHSRPAGGAPTGRRRRLRRRGARGGADHHRRPVHRGAPPVE